MLPLAPAASAVRFQFSIDQRYTLTFTPDQDVVAFARMAA
jgi:hypothetical protein